MISATLLAVFFVPVFFVVIVRFLETRTGTQEDPERLISAIVRHLLHQERYHRDKRR
jgi:hypothetical protein